MSGICEFIILIFGSLVSGAACLISLFVFIVFIWTTLTAESFNDIC